MRYRLRERKKSKKRGERKREKYMEGKRGERKREKYMKGKRELNKEEGEKWVEEGKRASAKIQGKTEERKIRKEGEKKIIYRYRQ